MNHCHHEYCRWFQARRLEIHIPSISENDCSRLLRGWSADVWIRNVIVCLWAQWWTGNSLDCGNAVDGWLLCIIHRTESLSPWGRSPKIAGFPLKWYRFGFTVPASISWTATWSINYYTIDSVHWKLHITNQDMLKSILLQFFLDAAVAYTTPN